MQIEELQQIKLFLEGRIVRLNQQGVNVMTQLAKLRTDFDNAKKEQQAKFHETEMKYQEVNDEVRDTLKNDKLTIEFIDEQIEKIQCA